MQAWWSRVQKSHHYRGDPLKDLAGGWRRGKESKAVLRKHIAHWPVQLWRWSLTAWWLVPWGVRWSRHDVCCCHQSWLVSGLSTGWWSWCPRGWGGGGGVRGRRRFCSKVGFWLWLQDGDVLVLIFHGLFTYQLCCIWVQLWQPFDVYVYFCNIDNTTLKLQIFMVVICRKCGCSPVRGSNSYFSFAKMWKWRTLAEGYFLQWKDTA